MPAGLSMWTSSEVVMHQGDSPDPAKKLATAQLRNVFTQTVFSGKLTMSELTRNQQYNT